MSHEQVIKLVEDYAARLGEHFEAVQIMVTWNEEGLTKNLNRGVGNWYARQGMAHEFINADVAQENARQIAERLEPPEDDWKQ